MHNRYWWNFKIGAYLTGSSSRHVWSSLWVGLLFFLHLHCEVRQQTFDEGWMPFNGKPKNDIDKGLIYSESGSIKNHKLAKGSEFAKTIYHMPD